MNTKELIALHYRCLVEVFSVKLLHFANNLGDVKVQFLCIYKLIRAQDCRQNTLITTQTYVKTPYHKFKKKHQNIVLLIFGSNTYLLI